MLGTGGHLAVAFGVLLKTLWAGTKYSCAPGKLKVSRVFTFFCQFDYHLHNGCNIVLKITSFKTLLHDRVSYWLLKASKSQVECSCLHIGPVSLHLMRAFQFQCN